MLVIDNKIAACEEGLAKRIDGYFLDNIGNQYVNFLTVYCGYCCYHSHYPIRNNILNLRHSLINEASAFNLHCTKLSHSIAYDAGCLACFKRRGINFEDN